ncbi:transcriptional regulator [Actinorhabdospora filicis]|uniref:Transcriptional regulator n=1 Tax=Actinorhabdospora filicis TaxID=1785913 RepID=A0A9W6SLW2_9ACTN|nr:helix-turn-helix transcriptional regulator [Actinorhabdospora filicis]GLZ78159.1 transcriptional regulator [Actinorhabdospora filicis]
MTEPNLTLRQVGRRLFSLRQQAGMSLRKVVATKILGSTKTLERLEAGTRVSLTYPAIRELCELYGAPPELTAIMVEKYKNADRSWGEDFVGAVIRDFHGLIDMEAYASSLHIYEPNLITGLAQTEQYARAAHERDPSLGEEVILRSLAVRMKRQDVFLGRDPRPEFKLLMGEAALMGACDQGQRDRLKELAAHPTFAIRVLPHDQGPYPSLRGPFTILRFADPEDPDCVYTEGLEGSRYDVKPATIEAYDRVFRSSFEEARPIEEW